MSVAQRLNCSCPPDTDSPLSTTANVAGILTFVYAVVAGVLGYMYLLRSFSRSDDSIARFYDAFAACALESDLVRRDILASSSANLVLDEALDQGTSARIAKGSEKGIADGLKAAAAIPLPARTQTNTTGSISSKGQMSQNHRRSTMHPETTDSPYLLDPDSLARLYSHVRAVEIDLQRSAAKAVSQKARDRQWSGTWNRILGRSKWINREGELQAGLEKREALTPRLLVVQMSLAASRSRVQAERMGELEDEISRLKDKVGSWDSDMSRSQQSTQTVDV